MSNHRRTVATLIAALISALVGLHLTSTGAVPGRNVVWWPADQFVLFLGWLVERSVTVRDALNLQVVSISALWFAAAFWSVASFALVRAIIAVRRRFRSRGI